LFEKKEYHVNAPISITFYDEIDTVFCRNRFRTIRNDGV
jgi:hypothetical protein